MLDVVEFEGIDRVFLSLDLEEGRKIFLREMIKYRRYTGWVLIGMFRNVMQFNGIESMELLGYKVKNIRVVK